MRNKKLKRGETDEFTQLVSSLHGCKDTRLEKKDDFLFVEHWKEGETPFNWTKQWEKLPLEILSTSGSGEKTIDATDDTHTTRKVVLPLHAKCSSIKSKKSIRLIEEGASYLSLNIFSDFEVTINAIDENHRMGTIFHIDNSLTQYSSMKEYICISCIVPLSWLEEINQSTSQQDRASTVELDFNIHCFSREYERFSADPDLHEKYSIEKGGTGYAFLADFRVE